MFWLLIIVSVYWLVPFLWKVIQIFSFRSTKPFPNAKRAIIIVYPHTSYWDTLLLTSLIVRENLYGKCNALTRGKGIPMFIRKVLSKFGLLFVDKDQNKDQEVDHINLFTKPYLCLYPEATRRYTEYWNDGFYAMSTMEDLPLILIRYNFRNKTYTISEPYELSGNVVKDMDHIRTFYSTDCYGYDEEKAGKIQLQIENLIKKKK